MKTFLKIVAWILGIPLFIVAVFVFFGFLAVRFNVWPPTCNILPIQEARRVCEFSKLDHAPKNKPAKISFWVTVPHNAPADKLLLSIEGKEPVEMEKINDTSFQRLVNATTGETLKYKYLRNNDTSFSDEKKFPVKSYKKTVYDHVSQWSDVPAPKGLVKDMSPLITT